MYKVMTQCCVNRNLYKKDLKTNWRPPQDFEIFHKAQKAQKEDKGFDSDTKLILPQQLQKGGS